MKDDEYKEVKWDAKVDVSVGPFSADVEASGQNVEHHTLTDN